jgi:hypothetical protein
LIGVVTGIVIYPQLINHNYHYLLIYQLVVTLLFMYYFIICCTKDPGVLLRNYDINEMPTLCVE